jgi:hypothetical protein
MTFSWKVSIDFDYTGNWSFDFSQPLDDVTAWVKSVSIDIGMQDDSSLIASVGAARLVMENSDFLFSTENAVSPYYGKLRARKPIYIQTYDGNTWRPAFFGFIESIYPAGGVVGRIRQSDTIIQCRDMLVMLQTGVDMPLMINKTGNFIVQAAINYALGAPIAAQTLTFVSNPGNNQTIALDGVTLTFKSSLSGGANEILIGATKEATAYNLYLAINRLEGAGTYYATNMTNTPNFIADVSGNVITVKATIRGVAGNAVTVVSNTAVITAGGATLTGGVDYPPAKFSLQTGKLTFPIAGDKWDGEKVNAMQVIEDVTNTERGRFYARRDGTLIWENQTQQFLDPIQPVEVSLNGEFSSLSGGLDVQDVVSAVKVKYAPRQPLTSGVIAKAASMITVPGTLSGNNVITVNLPFVDPVSGQPIAAQSVITPLEPYTDWTAYEFPDGNGDYTAPQYRGILTFAVMIKGTKAEVTITNRATGPLYILKLQIRGTGLITYNPTEVNIEDATSKQENGTRLYSLNLPLPVDYTFASALAGYTLRRWKDQQFRVKSIAFEDCDDALTATLLKLDIGSLVNVSDPASKLSDAAHKVAGLHWEFGANKERKVRINLARLEPRTFWIVGDPVYGVVGETTRPAL